MDCMATTVASLGTSFPGSQSCFWDPSKEIDNPEDMWTLRKLTLVTTRCVIIPGLLDV